MIPFVVSGVRFVLSLRNWLMSLTDPTSGGGTGGWWVSGVGAGSGAQYFNLLDFDTRDLDENTSSSSSNARGGSAGDSVGVDMEAFVEERYRRDERARSVLARRPSHQRQLEAPPQHAALTSS
ncbi:hypothetical protein PTSG_06390 [Salpingoeca rosetta]|uniref:Uncharacterized protein n=1 Tax=Salpingoeca rosetta (strain ATCC 50818 / BSB-021) TaxID=946362 RepID=F2UCS2_SALR5|nr:uncharacterized protein PTSG_06390 [Salpingoeca rosetta]EGD74379.1 hypothetical protein PTSG_06390 [Salpingoeca rosetta]|eukprot:XP_004993279.1 hypothetical protein PTSG_06390 [Salpingoeca rosetta]